MCIRDSYVTWCQRHPIQYVAWHCHPTWLGLAPAPSYIIACPKLHLVPSYTNASCTECPLSVSFFLDDQDCVTVGGADTGAKCVFPFRFQGQVFCECTLTGSEDGDTNPWCSTLTDQYGWHVGNQGNWGHCPTTCTTGNDE